MNMNIQRFSNPNLPMKVKVTLVRDGFNQPWGFRIAGGSDIGFPLTIQRALAGTPAEGELRPGDVVTKIGDHDARHISHQDAQNLFKHAGNNISVVVERGGAVKPNSAPMSPPLPPSVMSLPKPPVLGGVATPFAAAAAQRVAPMSPPAPAPSAPALSPPTPAYQPAPAYQAPAPAPAPVYQAPALTFQPPAPVPNYAPLTVQTAGPAPYLPEYISPNPIIPARGPNSLNALLSPQNFNGAPMPNNNHYSKTLLSPVQNLPVTVFPPPLPGYTPHSGQPRRPVTPNPYTHEVIDDPDCIDMQPYRTTPLVLPGAKVKREVPITSYLRHHPNPSVRASPHHFDPQVDVLMKQKVADTVLERVAGPESANKKVVHQFNSPINLYSDQNISEAVQSQTGVTPIFIDLSFLKHKQQLQQQQQQFPPPAPPRHF